MALLRLRPEFQDHVGRWIRQVEKDPFDPGLKKLTIELEDRSVVHEVQIEGTPFIVVMSIAKKVDRDGVRWLREVAAVMVPDREVDEGIPPPW